MGHDQSEGNDVQRDTLGTSFGMLLGAVIQVKDKTKMFKRILGYLKSTIDSLKPLTEEMTEYNKVLLLSKEELENFIIQMEKGAELVHKCSKIRRWASYKKYEYTNKILELDISIQLLRILRVQLVTDVRESLVSLSNTEAIIKLIEGKIEEGVKLVEGSSVVQLPNDQIENKGSCEVIAFDVRNVRGIRNGKETLDSTTNMEAAGKQIRGSVSVQNQIDVAEPASPIIQVADAQLKLFDWMIDSKDNQQGMDKEQKMVYDNFSFQQAIRPKWSLKWQLSQLLLDVC